VPSMSNLPGSLQWAVVIGDDVAVTLTFVDADSVAIDLSGRTYACSIYDATDLSTVVASATVGTGSAASGILTLSISDAVTGVLESATRYRWKLVETNGSAVATLLDGPFFAKVAGVAGLASGSLSVSVSSAQGAATVTATSGGGGGGGGAEALNDLSDVTITAAASGDILRHNGSAWVDTPGTTHYDAAGTAAAAVAAHEADAADAHDASAISILDAANDFTATDVEGALAELQSDAEADATALADHLADAADAHDASAISIADVAGDFTATDVEGALAELQADAEADAAALASYLPLVAAGASVENIGAVESNVQTVASTGATETLDLSVYGVFDMTMDQACTFTFSNPAPSGKATIFTLILRGAFTPTLPASVDWGDSTAPTYTTPSQYVFTTVDAGTTYLGQQVAKAFG
jgi:hypothetical protein